MSKMQATPLGTALICDSEHSSSRAASQLQRPIMPHRLTGMRVFASAVLLATSTALRLPAVARGSSTCSSPSLGRRDAVASGLLGAALGGLLVPPQAAFASGGATSGKTTSIPRAKLRYYGRMTTVITIFQGMKKPILAGDVKGAKGSFFTKEYETQDSSMSTAIDELKTAGYLLAVAFKVRRRDSNSRGASSTLDGIAATCLSPECSLQRCSLQLGF